MVSAGFQSPDDRRGQGWWFSDGYGDYIRHFLWGMASVPDWAPPGETHLLGSSSIVRSVKYEKLRVSWSTADASSVESLRVAWQPSRLTAGGKVLLLPSLHDEAIDGF